MTEFFEKYTLDDYKTFFSVASSVVTQNLFVSMQRLDKNAQKTIDDNLALIHGALDTCQSQLNIQLDQRKHFPDGSLGDVFEQVVLMCAKLKIPAPYQSRQVFNKPQNLKIQLKVERLRQKRKKYLKNSLRRLVSAVIHKTKKEK